MSSKNHLCPPLGALLDPNRLRMCAASFEATATDDALVLPDDRRRALWEIAASMRLAANVIDSGEAWSGGHLVALEIEMRGTRECANDATTASRASTGTA